MEPNRMVVSSPTFGNLLGGLFDNVNSTIKQAVDDIKNAAKELEIEASQDLTRAIDQIANCYEKELDKTIDKVSKEAEKAFNSLKSLVLKFEADGEKDLSEIMSQAQQIANTLPFSSHQPQYTSLKPRNAVISDPIKETLVKITGVFPYGTTPGYTPCLKFDDKQCPLVDASTQALIFQVPNSVLTGDNVQKFGYSVGELVVPWNRSKWLGKWHVRDAEYKYKIALGALPQQAGIGSVEYLANDTVRTTETTTNNYKFNGNTYYDNGHTHWHTCYQDIFPKEGWKIDVSKPPIMTPHHEHGDHNQEILSVSSEKIVLKVDLHCSEGHTIGIVNIDVKFDQYIDNQVENRRKEDFAMKWSESKLLEPKGNEKVNKVIFDDYKGSHQEYAGPDLKSGILKVEAEANGMWKVSAEPPQELTLKSEEFSAEFKKNLEIVQKHQHLLKIDTLPHDLRIKPIQEKKENSVNNSNEEVVKMNPEKETVLPANLNNPSVATSVSAETAVQN